MKRIGFLSDNSSTPSKEERAAWNLLSSLKSVRTERISFQSLNQRPARQNAKRAGESAISRLPHLLWWHFETSTQLPSVALNPEVVSNLRLYIEQGGSLLLSLLATPYIADLGVEDSKPNIVRKGAWDEANWAPEYPDIRGFATYLGHPIFEGLPGGVYTWNPVKGTYP